MKWIDKFNNQDYSNELLIGLYKSDLTKKINEKRLAIFDLDHTLISPKPSLHNKKKKIPTFPNKNDSNDWQFMYKNVKKKLLKLSEKYKLIIVSNQGGLKTDSNKKIWKERIEKFLNELNLPIIIFAATGKKYRKPGIKIFDDFFKNINLEKSFYCGDFYKDSKKSTDLKLAKNLGLNFKTPEEIFQKKKVQVPEIKYCLPDNLIKKDFEFSSKYFGKGKDYTKVLKKIKKISKKKKIVIVNTGFPGSGKSKLSEKIKKKFNAKIINKDTLKTQAKCVSEFKRLLKNKEKIIIVDNTNITAEERSVWINLAKENNYKIICNLFNTPIDLCKHNNIYRNLREDKKIVPDFVYRMMKSRFIEPTKKEGFSKVIKIKFTLSIKSEKNYKLYCMYLY